MRDFMPIQIHSEAKKLMAVILDDEELGITSHPAMFCPLANNASWSENLITFMVLAFFKQ